MRCLPPLLPTLSLVLLPALAAQAASSNWHQMEGGAIRVVTSAMPEASGQLRAALEINLKPGWKTYWRNPGASGVPPSLEFMAGAKSTPVEIAFPAPRSFDDGYAIWAGYDHPVALALTINLPVDAPPPPRLEANIFLGVCEAICIPVTTTLALDLSSNVNDPEHTKVVEAAFSALPQQARPGFSAKAVGKDNAAILIEAKVPDGVNIIDLFVAGTQATTLDTPQKTRTGAQALFRIPIMTQNNTGKEKLAYTLVTDDGAVTGHISLP